jgi:[acyl-carrier-protein] S-malonyltransferase
MKAVFLFPGQGAQAVGMCAGWRRTSPCVAGRLAQGSAALGIDLAKLIDAGPIRLLTETLVAQVSIYCLSFAIYEILRERGIHPTLLAGHSLGQFTALAASGAVSFEEGLALVRERGIAMHALNQTMDGAMLALQAGDLQRQLSGLVGGAGSWWIANRNAPGQWIAAGLRPDLRRLQSTMAASGVAAHWLDVAGPYHTPLMAPAAASFERVIQRYRLDDARVPVVSNSTAALLTTREQLATDLCRHMVSPVDWTGTMALIASQAPDLLIEVGPGRTLKGLVLRNKPQASCVTTASPEELERVCEACN